MTAAIRGANRSGRRLEEMVADLLEERDYQRILPSVRGFPARELEQPIYTRQYESGKDIYGKRRRVDFILYHPRLWERCLVIQCKWQPQKGVARRNIRSRYSPVPSTSSTRSSFWTETAILQGQSNRWKDRPGKDDYARSSGSPISPALPREEDSRITLYIIPFWRSVHAVGIHNVLFSAHFCAVFCAVYG